MSFGLTTSIRRSNGHLWEGQFSVFTHWLLLIYCPICRVAGGDKYVVHGEQALPPFMNGNSLFTSGILFKFCLDQVIETKPETVWMYGGKQANDDYGKFAYKDTTFIANLGTLQQ